MSYYNIKPVPRYLYVFICHTNTIIMSNCIFPALHGLHTFTYIYVIKSHSVVLPSAKLHGRRNRVFVVSHRGLWSITVHQNILIHEICTDSYTRQFLSLTIGGKFLKPSLLRFSTELTLMTVIINTYFLQSGFYFTPGLEKWSIIWQDQAPLYIWRWIQCQ